MTDPEQPKGDCFPAALHAIMRLGDPWLVVHAEVGGQGPLLGKRFLHAWVENPETGEIRDEAMGRTGDKASAQALLFYAIGRVSDARYYTKEEACKLAVRSEHYGPWEDAWDEKVGEARAT